MSVSKNQTVRLCIRLLATATATAVGRRWVVGGMFLAVALLVWSPVGAAQLPGITEPAQPVQAEPAAAPAVDKAPEPPGSQEDGFGVFGKYYARFMGSESPYRPVILTILTLVVLLQLKRFLTRRIHKHVKEEAFHPENADSFMRMWRWIWNFVIAVLAIMAMSGSLRLLGLTAGFLGMILGWSLQQPVTGVAAWLMVILKKPFKIGDRVVIGGITGDVTGITLTHVILNQVGGSVGGEERSGRGILIPNAILFQNIIINYTLEQEYMLDEVPVRLTFDSDWDRAKEILLRAASEATKEIISRTGQEPFIRAEFLDWGILVRLRYNTIPARRQELSTAIIEILLHEFSKEYPRVKFAIPSTMVRYRPDVGIEDMGAASRLGDGLRKP